MYHGNSNPGDFLSGFGIDFDNPTVRDAVAFDLVKLDDGSVSNDTVYTYPEHINYSPSEYERFLLNRNFRINLVNLETEWSSIGQIGTDVPLVRRTIDRTYQGVRFSETLLGYFSQVMDNGTAEGIYCPVTTERDFWTEVSLIPNTHWDFPAITSRAYYDMKYLEYKKMLGEFGITAISSFALVDPSKDKNHTGWYRIKV